MVKAKGEDKWLDTRCLRGLSRLLGRRVLGAKVHARSRSELFDHPGHRHNHRLSVMMTEDSDRGATLKDDEASGRRGRPKMKLAWEVLAVFYVAGVTKQIYFLDSPAGLGKMPLRDEEGDDLKSEYQAWSEKSPGDEDSVHSVYSVILKQNQKELNPKMFDNEDMASFRDMDIKECRQ